MRRIQFIEIHEQPWLPRFLRDEITDALQYGLALLEAYAPAVPLLQRALDSAGCRSIVDLCSGGGGPWLNLSGSLKGSAAATQICLTDRSPNLAAFHNARESGGNQITFCGESIDAMEIPRALAGFRTVFSSYHHFSPEQARAVLQNAVDAGEGIGIFEITRRTPAAIGLMLPWSLLVFVTTAWARPFRWSRLFWTYVIPLIPLVVLFDGVVSCLRTYRPGELREIIAKLRGPEYRWQVGENSEGVRTVPITYAIGYPATKNK
jgi:hypothetical protein